MFAYMEALKIMMILKKKLLAKEDIFLVRGGCLTQDSFSEEESSLFIPYYKHCKAFLEEFKNKGQ